MLSCYICVINQKNLHCQEQISDLNHTTVLCDRSVWFSAVGADTQSWAADTSGMDRQPSQRFGP